MPCNAVSTFVYQALVEGNAGVSVEDIGLCDRYFLLKLTAICEPDYSELSG